MQAELQSSDKITTTPTKQPSSPQERLIPLLKLYINNQSNKKLQLQHIPYQDFLTICFDPLIFIQYRMAACSALKYLITNFRELYDNKYQQILQHIQIFYLKKHSNDQYLLKMQDLLEILFEKIFEIYYDDAKKIHLFEIMMEKIRNNLDIRMSYTNLRILKMINMILRSMDFLTLNCEIFIGELVFYIEQLYSNTKNEIINNQIDESKGQFSNLQAQNLQFSNLQAQNLQFSKLQAQNLQFSKLQAQNQQKYNTKKKGLGILLQIIQQNSSIQFEYLEQFVQCSIQGIKLIKEIIDLIEDNLQQGENIAQQYMSGRRVQDLLISIISVNNYQQIFTGVRLINALKYEIIELYKDIYLYHVHPNLMILCMNTLTLHQRQHLIDQNQNIMTHILNILERATTSNQYTNIFFDNTQLIVLKLLTLIVARQAEKIQIQTDPIQFVEIAEDFCKKQQLEILKIRAGSLLSMLCLSIDGYLTFVVNICMVSLNHVQKQFLQNLKLNIQIREVVQNSDIPFKNLLNVWPGTEEQLIETSILLLSSLSDQIQKREQLHELVIIHLVVMQGVLKQKQRMEQLGVKPLIICRYMQLYAFYSFYGCYDQFLGYYSMKEAYSQSLLKGLQTIIHYHNKKQQNMRVYVIQLSQVLLLMCDTLTPLLEQTITNRFQILVCIKEKVLEKLVLWMQNYYQLQNVVCCHKIANLIAQLIGKFQLIKLQNSKNKTTNTNNTNNTNINNTNTNNTNDNQFQMMVLNQYLSPLYKMLLSKKQHPAEQCLIEIAIEHIEYLDIDLSKELAQNFYQMSVIIVQNNEYSLNSCLDVFNRLVCLKDLQKYERNKHEQHLLRIKGIQKNIAIKLISKLNQWMKKSTEREEDLWEILQLLEIVILVLDEDLGRSEAIDYQYLLEVMKNTKTKVIALKILIILISSIRFLPNSAISSQLFEILNNFQLPREIPPYECKPLAIYLMRNMNIYKDKKYKVYLLAYIMKLISREESIKHLVKKYEGQIFSQESLLLGTNAVDCNAFLKQKNLIHPTAHLDVYQEFRNMWKSYYHIDQLKNDMQFMEIQPNIKELLKRHRVGDGLRKVVTIKK